MCGHVEHREVFAQRPLDDLMRSILSQPDLRADSLLGRIADTIEDNGLPVADLRKYVGDHLVRPGLLGGNKAPEGAMRDLGFGWPLARRIADLNIGQAIMVRNGVVVAVEAAEGTDEMIERGGRIAGPGSIVIKLPLSGKDPRFDIPVIGSDTTFTMAKAGAVLLAVAAGNTIVIDPRETMEAAESEGVSIIANELEWEG